MSSFYTCVPKITIIWDSVPEIRSETKLSPPLLLPPHSPFPNNGENQNFEKCSWEVQQKDFFCHHRPFFLPLYSPNSSKNENIKNMKKTVRNIISLHKSTKNHNHMLYSSWDMAHDGCNCYFHFGLYFYLLPP